MSRTKLSTVAKRLEDRHRISIGVAPGDGYRALAFMTHTKRVLFTVSPDDLFDADGNRFEDDLP